MTNEPVHLPAGSEAEYQNATLNETIDSHLKSGDWEGLADWFRRRDDDVSAGIVERVARLVRRGDVPAPDPDK